MMIPENAPVRLLNARLEELEYGKLYEAYSFKGRKSAADLRVLFKVLVHGYLCGIYSSLKLEEACQYRINFRWLLEDPKKLWMKREHDRLQTRASEKMTAA